MEDTEDDIAIVGIGCNFPGGEGLDNFWKVLLEGKNCVEDIPIERFDSKFWFDADDKKPGKTQTTKAALIEGFDEFDFKFFGVTEMEAECMDPQQKLLLQCAYRALEDAGISMESISGSRTGVYIGLMNRDYEMIRNNNPATITHYNSTGTTMSIAANRISYTFNLTGPSFAIDSACSSSLVALHLACQAIKQGDCDMALCGGVNCIIEPRVFVALSKAKMISPEGTSKPFSSRADGYGRGEGCGVVLLKPLKNAKKDLNKIWGVISKTAVNQDGRSVTPITKPSMDQQEQLLRSIYSESDIANVQYIEAHGTGTPIGDPTETGSISKVISQAKPSGSKTLMIGSLKGNIGHTESAAGVAGLIKVLLMMKHETIVSNVFFSEENSSVDIEALNLKIITKAEPWGTNGPTGRVAGINNFGFGGTNAHAILRESKHTTVLCQIPATCPKIFVISAATERSLIWSISDTLERLIRNQSVDLQALSYTSACGRSHHRHKYRKALRLSSLSDLKNQLSSALKTKVESGSDIQVVFVFCGNGVAYRGMCRDLMGEFPVFRDKVKEVEELFQRHKTISICKWLDGEHDDDSFSKPEVVQPLLFAIQIGIVSLLKQWGVRANAMLGHSVGEVAAAHCSGLLSLEDAVKVLHIRSSLQTKVTGGKMLVVGNVAVEKMTKILSDFSGKICIAAYNSPLSCTLSGESEAVKVLHEKLRVLFPKESLHFHLLDVPAAYHSQMMDPILDDIEKSIDVLDAFNIDCTLFSTVTGQRCSDGDFRTGRYWTKNIREPVLFEQTIHAAFKDKQSKRNVVFVEIGPRRALQRNICEILGNDTIVLSSAHSENDCDTILSSLAKLFELGINVDWHQVYRGCETVPIAFPVYQFDNTRKKIDFEAFRKSEDSFAFAPYHLVATTNRDNKEFMCNLSSENAPYLWQHKINSISTVPGAFYVELALTSVMASLRSKIPASQLHLSFKFESLLTLNLGSQKLKITLDNTEKKASFKIQSLAATHASGTYKCTDSQSQIEVQNICLDTITRRCKLVLMRQEIYFILSQAGFEYGPLFKQLDVLRFGTEFKEAVATVKVPEKLLNCLHDYFVHPVVLDHFLQMTAVVATGQMTARQGFPSGIRSFVVSGPLQKEMVIYLRATEETSDFLEVCGCLSTINGQVLVELKGVRISFLGSCSKVPQSLFFHNEPVAISKKDLQNDKMKAIVFEDELCIAKKLRPYMSSESIIVESKQHWEADQIRNVVLQSLNDVDLENVLFFGGVENLNYLSCEQMLYHLVTCCEMFRQIVLCLKEKQSFSTVRVITYRSTEITADRVSAGFVLGGMMRACAAELSGLSFQLIDLASVTDEDIQTLASVINTCKQQEIRISGGQASATRIAQTPMKDNQCEDDIPSVPQGNFVLQTADPYKIDNLSATPDCREKSHIKEKSVEIQLTSVCIHSADYFPVSSTHLNFGKTMYWNKHSSNNHKLLALDFSGVVTAVGGDVQDLRVGDHIASCYPVVATSKIVIPEAACYNTKKLLFLRETPCVSYLILAWVILHKMLSGVKRQQRKLAIISSSSASALMKVLALTANRSGWNVSSWQHSMGKPLHFQDRNVLIFLAPFTRSWQEIPDIGGCEKHIIFVYSSFMASLSASMFASKSDNIHVHEIDVATVLQKANLRAQNTNVLCWLQSMGFDSISLPLKIEVYQPLGTTDPEFDPDLESYFTTNKVRQVILNHGHFDSPVSNIQFLPTSRQLFKQNCVYVVTGGLSGLGLETVKFIAHNGGECIATLSRSILSDEKQFQMDLLQKRYSVSVLHIQCDVSDSMQVVAAISKIKQRFPSCPIKGVFHSAAVLQDALIESLDESLFRKVLMPKVKGALNLHFATLHSKLDFFVCYSSISSFIGNAAQCNYAAANSFLDMFCHYRRNLGLAGQSINWGPLNLGLLLNQNHFQKFLEAKGMMILNVYEVHETLKKCLLLNRPQQVICKFNFRNLNIHVLSQNASLRDRLSTLVELELRENTYNEPNAQLVSSTSDIVKAIVSEMTNVSAENLSDESTLSALGVDSMLAMTLQNKVFQETGVNVPLILILNPSSTLAKLVAVISKNR